MSPEPGPGAERSERRWSLLQQGSFVRGRCDVCGFLSPARRATFTVESDLDAHEVLCQASEQFEPVALGASGAAGAGTLGEEPVADSAESLDER